MTTREFSILLKAIKDIYDRKDFLDTDSKKSTWYALLKDLDYKTAAAALQAYMSSPDGHFEPKPADIRKYAVKAMPELDFPNEQEALAKVIRAVRNGIYGADEEFEKMPPIIQKAVGAPAVLTTWATQQADASGVWQSQFLKQYRAVLKRANDERALPEKMRAYTLGLEEHKARPEITQKAETAALPDKDYSPKGKALEAVRKAREALGANT